MAVSGRKVRKVAFTTFGASLVTFFMAAAFSGMAVAGPFEDAASAYARGDYGTAMRLCQRASVSR